MKVDLHIHTTASDGTWTPQELVAQAQRAGLGALAVTDHDSVANVAETKRLAEAAGIKFLTASEICATKNNIMFHILGYGIDINNKHLLQLLQHNEDLLQQKDVESIALLEKENWPVSVAEFSHYDYDRRRGGWRALAYLQDKGLCKDVNDFFSRIFTKEHKLGFPVFPPVDEVIKAIHQAGGVALCAHAASDFHGPGVTKVLEMLAEEKFDGFECYHSGHSEEDTELLLDYCRKNRLMISGGSDCHGTFVKTRFLGQPKITAEDLYLPGLLQA